MAIGSQTVTLREQISSMFQGYSTPKNVGFDLEEDFLFGGLPSTLLRALSLSKASPPNKKITSLRAQRLCGEISILSKHAKAYLMKGG